MGGLASATRGVFTGGFTGPATLDVIQYITIASPGNTTDFGDLAGAARNCNSCASSTRGLKGGGSSPAGNVIEFITIASPGDATDFGDLTAARNDAGTSSNNIRAVWAGGGSTTNIIDYVTIASAGDAADFGDLTVSITHHEGSSNGHGGLG